MIRRNCVALGFLAAICSTGCGSEISTHPPVDEGAIEAEANQDALWFRHTDESGQEHWRQGGILDSATTAKLNSDRAVLMDQDQTGNDPFPKLITTGKLIRNKKGVPISCIQGGTECEIWGR